MRSHVFIVLSEVSVPIRRQQIAPKFSIFSFGGGQVKRKAGRTAKAFKDAIKDVVHGECSNSSHIQIMELVLWELTLFKSLTNRSIIWLKSIFSWGRNNNICALLRANKVNRAHITLVVLPGPKSKLLENYHNRRLLE